MNINSLFSSWKVLCTCEEREEEIHRLLQINRRLIFKLERSLGCLNPSPSFPGESQVIFRDGWSFSPLPEYCPEEASPHITAPHYGVHLESTLDASRIGLEAS